MNDDAENHPLIIPVEQTDQNQLLNKEQIESQIAAGVEAYTKLLDHSSDDWTSWSIIIVGFRALRTLAFNKANTSDIKSWPYRKELTELMQQKKYSVYDRIGKQTRSTCYKLMDRIEEVDAWYLGLPPAQKLQWKHPDAIAKHCPKYLVQGGIGSNSSKKISSVGKGRKPPVSAESERLRTLLIQTIKQLAKYEPEAIKLLEQAMPPTELSDPVDNI